jgi:predicted DNA-binding transcriptional regulator YafY
VGRRTIFRDLETLREAGVPLEFDQQRRRFSIRNASFLPPTELTPEETLSLLLLASDMGRHDGLPYYDASYTAAMKLRDSLPAPLRREIGRSAQRIKIRIEQVTRSSDKSNAYQAIVEAIAKRSVVQIDYQSFTEWEQISTKLRPYQLIFSRRSWYVIGRSSLHRDVRMFNVARIVSLKLLKQRFVIPRSFDLDEYLGNAWHLIPTEGSDSHIVVRFKSLVAGNVAAVMWHKTQKTKFLPDGSLEFRATVSGLTEIAWWILGYGDQAEVLRPAKLRRIIAARAKNMAAMYNGSG